MGGRARWHSDDMDRSDRLVAAGVTGIALVGLVVGRWVADPPIHDLPPWVVALVLLQGGVLLWRRSRPVEVLMASSAAVLALALLRHPIAGAALGPMAAAWAVGVHAASRRAWLLVPPVAIALSVVGAGIGFSTGEERDPIAHAVTTVALYVAVFLAGRLLRTRREAAAERTRAAVAEERGRIARELHDVVAHHMGVVSLHAGAGRRLVDHDPEAAKQAFAQIERSTREALAAMPALVGSLRDGNDVAAPQPRLDDLERLVAGVVDAGQRVTLVVEGDRRELPAAVELSAYRIVQEAVTNAGRHAGPARVDVTVRFTPDALELAITDDGRGDTPPDDGRGYGITGMKERVRSLGGTCDIGPRPGGGFSVQATLPITTAGVR